TFSSIFTNVSPSGNGLTMHLPNSMSMELQIALLKIGFAVPLKIFTIVTLSSKTKNHPPQVDKNATANLTAGKLCANRFWPRCVFPQRDAVVRLWTLGFGLWTSPPVHCRPNPSNMCLNRLTCLLRGRVIRRVFSELSAHIRTYPHISAHNCI